MKVILLSGKAKSGKDTVASIMKNKLEAQGKKVFIVHFADYLKSLATQLYAWDGKKDEKGRTLLQWLGTDIIRKRQPDFWVETVARLIDVLKSDYDYCIIPDTRFKNEITWWDDIDDIEHVSIKINRINYTNDLTSQQQAHTSEHDLDDFNFDIDFYIKEGIDQIELAVNQFLNTELKLEHA